jgi:hypothetical protein
LNTGWRYLICLCVSFMTLQAVAQDMSAWSDKTVCRLAMAGGGQEHIDEATKRGLDCASPKVRGSAISSSSPRVDPLDALTIPKNWQPIKNQKVFDQERKAVKSGMIRKGHSSQYKLFAEQCFEIMYHFNDSLMYFWKNQKTLEKLSSVDGNTSDFKPNVANCLGYYANLPGVLGETPKEMMQLLEMWAEEDTFSLPKNRADKSYNTTIYGKIGTLTVLATYYALYYDEFQYSTVQRELVDGYLTTFLLNVNTRARIKSGSKQCDPARLSSLAKDQINDTVDGNSCGSTVWKTIVAQLLLGLRLNNEAVFKKGIANTQYQLNFFDKEGTFVTWANKGASSMQYTGDLPTFLGLLTETFATIDYDFMSHKIPNGLSIKQVMDRQVDIHQDHKLIWKYAKTQRSTYKGVATKEFLTWSSEEALDLAGTNLKTLVREMARYVDTYRPDLQSLRDQNYVFMDDREQHIDVLATFHAIEPYKLYEANTKKGVDKTAWSTVGNSIIKNMKIKNAQDLAYAVGQGYDHQENYLQQPGIDNHAGKYKLHWYFLNINCKSNCSNEYQGLGTLTLANGIGKFKPKYGQPSANLRKMLTVYYDKDGSIAVSGTLDLWEKERAYPTLLKGNLADSSTVSGIWEEGDTIGFKFVKVE